jgi:hypothetical protein
VQDIFEELDEWADAEPIDATGVPTPQGSPPADVQCAQSCVAAAQHTQHTRRVRVHRSTTLASTAELLAQAQAAVLAWRGPCRATAPKRSLPLDISTATIPQPAARSLRRHPPPSFPPHSPPPVPAPTAAPECTLTRAMPPPLQPTAAPATAEALPPLPTQGIKHNAPSSRSWKRDDSPAPDPSPDIQRNGCNLDATAPPQHLYPLTRITVQHADTGHTSTHVSTEELHPRPPPPHASDPNGTAPKQLPEDPPPARASPCTPKPRRPPVPETLYSNSPTAQQVQHRPPPVPETLCSNSSAASRAQQSAVLALDRAGFAFPAPPATAARSDTLHPVAQAEIPPGMMISSTTPSAYIPPLIQSPRPKATPSSTATPKQKKSTLRQKQPTAATQTQSPQRTPPRQATPLNLQAAFDAAAAALASTSHPTTSPKPRTAPPSPTPAPSQFNTHNRFSPLAAVPDDPPNKQHNF